MARYFRHLKGLQSTSQMGNLFWRLALETELKYINKWEYLVGSHHIQFVIMVHLLGIIIPKFYWGHSQLLFSTNTWTPYPVLVYILLAMHSFVQISHLT